MSFDDLDELKRDVAIEIAVEVDVLERCEDHEEFLFEGNEYIAEAYKVAAARIKAEEYADMFESQKELTDLIKEVVDEYGISSSCLRCKHLQNDD